MKLHSFGLRGKLPASDSAERSEFTFVVEGLEHFLDPPAAAHARFEDVQNRLSAPIVLGPMRNADEAIMHEPTVGTAERGPDRRRHFPFEICAHYSAANAEKCLALDDVVRGAKEPGTALLIPTRVAAKLTSEAFEVYPMESLDALSAPFLVPAPSALTRPCCVPSPLPGRRAADQC